MSGTGRDEVLARIADAVTLAAADRDAARTRLVAVWAEVETGDALHRCVLAHYLADLQDDVRDELRWDLRALAAADEVAAEERAPEADVALDVRTLYPSLHLNLGDDYRRLGAAAQAREHLALAQAVEHVLPDDGYGRMIRGGIANLAGRLEGAGAITGLRTRAEAPPAGRAAGRTPRLPGTPPGARPRSAPARRP